MPMLGDMLAAARHSAGGFQQWLAVSEPELAAEVGRAASSAGLSVTAFVRAAVADFARLAGEEDWATLISSLRDSEDPGTICLLAMVHWRLTASACDHHAHHGHGYPARGAEDERSERRHA